MTKQSTPLFRLAVRSEDPILPVVFRQPTRQSTIDRDSTADSTVAPSGLSEAIGSVWLVHGTFVGNDALGVVRDIGRVFPELASPIQRWQKQLLDSLLGDRGNYSQRYADRLAAQLSSGDSVPVKLFHWSSENHHIGRADGAVSLLESLAADMVQHDGRVLVLSHSHGGNVLALVTNLLGGNPQAVERFFDLSQWYWRLPWGNSSDLDRWPHVRDLLLSGKLDGLAKRLDIVTFGTPVLYGWERRGCNCLMHVVHHRPADGHPADRAVFPFSIDDFRRARHGDYVQQIGIAGSGVSPGLLQWRARRADKRLGQWLHPGLSRRNLLKRLKAGWRTHREGHNLLVEYESDEQGKTAVMGGHAVYTLLEWIPFHVQLIDEFFYRDPTPAAGQSHE